MKKNIKILTGGLVVLCALLLSYLGIINYLDYKEKERIKNAIVKIEYISPLEVEFNEEVSLSDIITSINGVLISDFKIDTSTLGEQEINYKYLNEEDIKVPIKVNIKVVDKTPPVIWLNDTYTVKVGFDKRLEDAIMCGDNYDDNPLCTVKGEYNLNRIGNYNLIYEAIDNSGNKTSKNFVLKVLSKLPTSQGNASIPFKSLYNEYKKDNTKIGIDVSKWQGDIDYQKVKDEGVEFVFIKMGGQNGIKGDYYLDPKFERNLEGFKSVGIPIGLYFYTYADSILEAEREALWIIDNLKGEKIDLPIAFDWENWSSYNSFHISFNNLTKMAGKFIDTLSKHGYSGMLYGSKNYLEQIFLKNNYTTWVAHYTEQTNYNGKYMCWQRTNMAKISGITGNTVDFDICYIDNE